MQRRGWFRFVTTTLTLFGYRRMFGLSAEGAFWATFTLPWLFLGVLAATSGLARLIGRDVGDQVRSALVQAAGRVLTPEAISGTLEPLLDSLQQGSTGLSILGFVVALWSGSRVFATFVAGAEILDGRQARGFVATRAIALGIYVLGLISFAVVAVTIVLFPDFWAAILGLAPGGPQAWAVALLGVGMIGALTTILFLSDASSTNWAQHLPGGVLALAVWVVASAGLSLYFRTVVEHESVYGAVASPIAIMLWLFVSVLALFVGMTVNAGIRLVQRDLYLDPWAPQEGPLQASALSDGVSPDVSPPPQADA